MMRLLILCLFLSGPARAGTGGDIESRVSDFSLANGLKVIIYVDSSAPVVSVNAYYRVGAYDEPIGLTGISHMVEHMSFKHTDIYRPGDFDRMLDEVGAFNNGFTSTYYSGYYEDIARDRWDLALKLEAARMGGCIFPDSEFQSEHQVVTEECRLGENNPHRMFYQLFDATALSASPLRNPVIGWSADVRRYTVQAVSDWYARYYNAANAVLVVAGDVRPDEARARVEKYFGKLKGRPATRTDFYDIEPRNPGARRLTVRKRVGMPLLVLGWPAPGRRDSATFAGDLLAAILSRGRNSRLQRALVNDSGLATSVSAGNGVTLDPEHFVIRVTPKAESLIPRIQALVDRELERVKRELVSDRELTMVKNQVTASEMFGRDDISDIARMLAYYQIIDRDWRRFRTDYERTLRVSKEEVRDFARTWLEPDNRVVGELLPEKRGER